MFLLDICWTWSVHAKGPASFGNSIRDARLVFSFWPFVRVAAGGRGREGPERDDVLLSVWSPDHAANIHDPARSSRSVAFALPVSDAVFIVRASGPALVATSVQVVHDGSGRVPIKYAFLHSRS